MGCAARPGWKPGNGIRWAGNGEESDDAAAITVYRL